MLLGEVAFVDAHHHIAALDEGAEGLECDVRLTADGHLVLIAPEGRLVIIGLAGGTLPVSFFAVPYGAEVATSYWGTATELVEHETERADPIGDGAHSPVDGIVHRYPDRVLLLALELPQLQLGVDVAASRKALLDLAQQFPTLPHVSRRSDDDHLGLDQPGVVESLTGRMVALPAHGLPRMNRLTLTRGAWIDAPGGGGSRRGRCRSRWLTSGLTWGSRAWPPTWAGGPA